jgi:hypothetical protein
MAVKAPQEPRFRPHAMKRCAFCSTAISRPRSGPHEAKITCPGPTLIGASAWPTETSHARGVLRSARVKRKTPSRCAGPAMPWM